MPLQGVLYILLTFIIVPVIRAQLPAQCALPLDRGACFAAIPMYGFDTMLGRCVGFLYGGCNGNANRFESLNECVQVCEIGGPVPPFQPPPLPPPPPPPSPETPVMPALCSLWPDSGPCFYYTIHYTFDIFRRKCIPFYYGGCGGNENRFSTLSQCKRTCEDPLTVTPEPDAAIPSAPELCMMPIDKGPCSGYMPQYAYDSGRQECVPFVYGGCQGNANRFESRQQCEATCRPSAPTAFTRVLTSEPTIQRCSLPTQSGPCQAYIPQYTFDTRLQQCVEFIYGGCGGNENRFNSLSECKAVCESGDQLGSQLADTDVSLPGQCMMPIDKGPCLGLMPQYAYDSGLQRCVRFDYGGCQGNANRFETQAECEAACQTPTAAGFSAVLRSSPIPQRCSLPTQTGPCKAFITQYTFDSGLQQCVAFTYGGCGGNENRFNSLSECRSVCEPEAQLGTQLPETDTSLPGQCMMPIDKGPCLGLMPQYAYDSGLQRCVRFDYGGCQGNANRFETQAECEAVCQPPTAAGFSVVLATSPIPPGAVNPCTQPIVQGPCMAIQHMYAYNATSSQCVPFVYGGCEGNDNRFATLSECESECGATDGPVVSVPGSRIPPRCFEPQASGPCSNFHTQYTYNSITNECKPFLYGGCGGNNNRFSSKNECQIVCQVGVMPRELGK